MLCSETDPVPQSVSRPAIVDAGLPGLALSQISEGLTTAPETHGEVVGQVLKEWRRYRTWPIPGMRGDLRQAARAWAQAHPCHRQ
jgi:hypothetical protein